MTFRIIQMFKSGKLPVRLDHIIFMLLHISLYGVLFDIVRYKQSACQNVDRVKLTPKEVKETRIIVMKYA